MIILFLSLSFISIILSQEADNKTQEIPIEMNDPSKMKVPIEEMDKLIACYFVVSTTLQNEVEILNNTAIRCNKTYEEMQYKISYEKMNNCYKNITKELTSKYVKNLESIKDPRTEELLVLGKTDYESYTNESNYQLTNEETITAFKFQKAKFKFDAKQRDLYRDNKHKEDFSIAGVEIDKINPLYKSIFFLIIVSLFTFGLIYLLGIVTKKENKKKKKRN